jgi:hypothetical protein
MPVFGGHREGDLDRGGVTAMRDFQEIQYLAWWVGLILIGIGIVLPIALIAAGRCILRLGPSTGASARTKRAVTVLLGGAAAFAVLLSGWIFLSFGVMTTDVTPSEVRVRFGWLPGYTESVPTSEIQSAEAIRYNPMEYGGWGMKQRSENDRVLSQRGDQAVRLQLVGGRQLLIGSQRPEALLDTIKRSWPQAEAGP